MDIGRIAGERSYVGHACIHVGGPHRMADSFILFGHRLVRLAVFVAAPGVSALVEEELGLVEILLFPGDEVEFGHFCYLVSRHADKLPGARSDFPALKAKASR